MPQLVHIVFQGALPAGDVFQHGFYCQVDESNLISEVASAADDALTAFLTGDANLKGYYQAETVWSAPLVEFVNVATGEIIDSLHGSVSQAGDHVGGVNLPGEVACCTTFRSAVTTGRGRGRSYLPAPGNVALTNNGRWTTAFVDAVNGAWIQCFDSLLTSDVVATMVVWSKTDGAAYELTNVEVGDVPDAQRSRRNGITETRTGLPWPA